MEMTVRLMECRLLSSGDNPVQSKHLMFGICGMSHLLVPNYDWSRTFQNQAQSNSPCAARLLYFYEVDTENL